MDLETSVIEQLLTDDDEPYLAVVVPSDDVRMHLDRLREHLGEADYARYTTNQQLRDGGKYHITVINPVEHELLSGTGEVLLCGDEPVKYRLVGLGCVREGSDTACFAVCESADLQRFRASLGLPPKDLHVTLGFDVADVHGVPKDYTTLVAEPDQ